MSTLSTASIASTLSTLSTASTASTASTVSTASTNSIQQKGNIVKQKSKKLWKNSRKKTPTVLQMEALECGAAALAMILGYYGRIVPLEELRIECGVSRDGSKASNVLKAARKYGMEARGFRKEPDGLRELNLPMIIFWNFNHFVVLEGIKRKKVYINDPATGPKVINFKDFDLAFTGVTLTFKPGPDFKKGGQKPGMFKALKRRLKGAKLPLVYVILAGLFLVIPGLLIPTFSKIFVDSILVGQMKNQLRILLLAMAITACVRAFLTWLQEYYLLRLEVKLALSSSAKFFHHIFRLPINFFEQRFGGEIGNRVHINDKVSSLISGDIAKNILNMAMFSFYAALMFLYDGLLTIVGISIAMINLIALKLISRKRVDLNQKLLQEQGKLIGVSMSGLQMIETIKASGNETDFFAKWSGYQAKVLNAEQELGISTRLLSALPVLLTSLNNIAILSLGALRVMKGHLSMGDLVAFQSLMASFIAPINQLVNLGSKIQELRGDINRLDDVNKHPKDKLFDDEEKSISNYHLKKSLAEKIKLTGKIDIKDICFGYNKLEPNLIENFSLSLTPGSKVAIVGGSGSGKSTIAKLIADVYNPNSGDIFFDNINRKDIKRSLINNSLSIVDQEIFMFEGSIKDNLTMWDRSMPEANIIQAAKDACIHDDISARPSGYESMVAEGASNFSGGQRQRLEIARALVINPSIIIMDEATSALDANIEKIINDNIKRRGCTAIIIAHRLSTIRDCDEIIVMDKGKVVQRGNHNNMKNIDGPYSKLITTV